MAALDPSGQPLPDDYEVKLAQQQAEAQLAAQRAAMTHESPLPLPPAPAPNTLRAAMAPAPTPASPLGQQAEIARAIEPPAPLAPVTQQSDAEIPGGSPPPAPAAKPNAPKGPSAERQAITDLKAAGNGEQEAVAAQGDAEAAAASKKADLVEVHAEEQRKAITAREQLDAKIDAGRAEFQRKAEEAEQAARDYKFTDYFTTRTTGQKFLILLGTVMAGRTPGDAVDKAIDGHFKRQQEQATSLKQFAAAKRQGVKDYDQWSSQQRAQFDIRAAMAKDAAATELEAQSLRSQDATIRARAQTEAAKLRQSAAKQLFDAENAYANSQADRELKRAEAAHQRAAAAGAGAGKAPTESQTKNAFLGQQMQDDLAVAISGRSQLSPDVLDKVQSNRTSMQGQQQSAKGVFGSALVNAGRSAGAIPKSPYDGLTPAQQRAVNAIDNAAEKYARMLSGAGMPAEEANRMAEEAKPHAGDSPQVVNMKLLRLTNAAKTLSNLSGSAGQVAAQSTSGLGSASSGPAEGATATNPQTGQRVVFRGGKWQALQ